MKRDTLPHGRQYGKVNCLRKSIYRGRSGGGVLRTEGRAIRNAASDSICLYNRSQSSSERRIDEHVGVNYAHLP